MTPAKPHDAPWLSPYIMVKDVDAAMEFYLKAFRFEKRDSAPGEDGTTWHAELRYKDQLVMLGKQGGYDKKTLSPATSGVESPMMLYFYCEDVDKFYQHAVAAGAKSLGEPEDMFWGDRMCRLQDPDGYIWSVATHQTSEVRAEDIK
jgi:PhnB protein